jgi:hypothetical protein
MNRGGNKLLPKFPTNPPHLSVGDRHVDFQE